LAVGLSEDALHQANTTLSAALLSQGYKKADPKKKKIKLAPMEKSAHGASTPRLEKAGVTQP